MFSDDSRPTGYREVPCKKYSPRKRIDISDSYALKDGMLFTHTINKAINEVVIA